MARKATRAKSVKTRRKKRDPIKPLEGHDEPIVVDNGPLRVDFGQGSHQPIEEPTSNRKRWTRKVTTLSYLTILVEEDAPTGPDPSPRNRTERIGSKVVTLVLAAPDAPATEVDRLTFRTTLPLPDRRVDMRAGSTQFNPDPSEKGVLRPYTDLRVKEILLGSRSLLNCLTPADQFKFRKVSLVLVPETE